MQTVEPFRIEVPDEALADLDRRLAAARWPSAATSDGWEQGVPLDHLRAFCEHWRSAYDWRASEARLNEVPQFQTTIDGLRWHFVHAESPQPDAVPLVLTHGWPGSFREFTDLVAPLTSPPEGEQAFHVVCPSLPGFAFSEAPEEAGWKVERIADGVLELMSRLGYDRFFAHGGDWGSVVTAVMAERAPERVLAVHLTIPVVLLVTPEPEVLAAMSEFERRGQARADEFAVRGAGYFTQMATKPQTLAYGLADSPVAQAAWILEKFHGWTDCDGDPRNAVSWDTILDDVMLYWLTGNGPAASRIYWESMYETPTPTVTVPAGCSIYPYEHVRVPRAVAEGYLTNLVHWSERPRGGHFASLEVPEDFIDQLRATYAAAKEVRP
jgi:epoxide hydrolase